jgi:putative transposase
VKYAYIRDNQYEYPIVRLCSLLEVSTSGYYDWKDRPLSKQTLDNHCLTAKICCLHKDNHEIYGSPNIHQDLLDEGEKVSVNRVARLMRASNIKAKTAKRFVITTHSKNTLKPAPDLLKRQFSTTQKNQAWVIDTTFIATRKGWLYLATVLDLYSRKIIGWSMSHRNNSDLVCDVLTMAHWRRKRPKDVIVHSDQGSTYASNAYQALLKRYQARCSMSRKGDCWDNAVAESFFGSLKTEWVDECDYLTHDEAKKSIFSYIELFYNSKRRHSHLGYKSPAKFEQETVS